MGFMSRLSAPWSAPDRFGLPGAVTSLAVLPAAMAVARSISLPQSEGDYWWHVAVGNWIIDHHAVPHSQWISWLADKPSWISEEWLGEVLMAAMSRFGPLGSVWLFDGVAILIWLAFVSLLRVVLRVTRPEIGTRPIEAGVLMLLAFAVAAPVWGPRLQLFGILWALLTVRIAYGYLAAGERRGIFLLPLVLVAWSNTHMGSFLLSVPLVAGLAIGDALDRRRLPDRRFFAVAGIAFAAALLNPYGVSAYTFPFQTILSPAAQSLIVEWKAPDFQDVTFRGLELVILGGFLVLPFGARRLDFKAALIAAGLLFMALQSRRHDAFFGLVGIALLAPALIDGFETLLAKLGYRATEFRRSTTWVLRVVAAVTIVGAVALTAFTVTDGPGQDRVTALNQPVAAATAAKPYLDAHPGTRVMAEYLWGGYLYETLGVQAGLYGASEAFTDQQFKAAADVELLNVDPAPFLDSHGVGMVILPPEAPLAWWLGATSGWHELYHDDVALVFVRT